MLCLKAERQNGEIFASPVPVYLFRGRSIQMALQGEGRVRYLASDPSSSSFCGDGRSHFEEKMSIPGPKEADSRGKMRCYRFHLEKEVQILEKQLQGEINLHVALANAEGNNALPKSRSPSELPVETQELLATVDELEITVAKLEEELFSLRFLLQYERSVHCAAESHLKDLPISALEPPTSGYIWEDLVSPLRVLKHGSQVPTSPHLHVLPGSEDLESATGPAENSPINELFGPCCGVEEKKQLNSSLQLPFAELKELNLKNLWQDPNDLSEEMVLCMRNIFLRLSGSPIIASKAYLLECLPLPSSPAGHLSHSPLTSFSDSSRLPSAKQSSEELNHNFEVMNQEKLYDPYGVNERVNWREIGKYSYAAEVSWMSVGKAQLDYAAEALKKFRFLVEQLAMVDPSQMSSDEKLAFWINLYNALLMHAYLAYGVPKSDTKLFSLMQKACYTVGGQSFSAAEIEFVILKMKPPAHRPHMALVLSLHKFKMTEEHRRYSIDCPEPLALFALSCGMYSCPALRIFTANNVRDELQQSMKDYIQASVGINEKGKLLVPKLLYCFAKGFLEDSLVVDWICQYLTPEQAAIVGDSTSKRKHRLFSVRSFGIIPFNSKFRYLFFPWNKCQECPALRT